MDGAGTIAQLGDSCLARGQPGLICSIPQGPLNMELGVSAENLLGVVQKEPHGGASARNWLGIVGE